MGQKSKGTLTDVRNTKFKHVNEKIKQVYINIDSLKNPINYYFKEASTVILFPRSCKGHDVNMTTFFQYFICELCLKD